MIRPPTVIPGLEGWDVRESRILVIDDEEANLELLRELLRREGYTDVHCLSDAARAMSVFLETRPDIVLLDLMMPVVDGYAVLESLARLVPADDFVPVIVLTADASIAARRRALALGARDFVNKPFDLIELALRMSNLLELRMLHRRIMNMAVVT